MQAWGVVALATGLLVGCVPPSPPQPSVSASPSAAAPATKRIAYEDPGVFTLPDGTSVLADADSGFTLPNGARVVPDGAGGLTLPNGARCKPDGAQGYLCP